MNRIFKIDSDEVKFNAVNAVKGLNYENIMQVIIEPWTEKRTRGQNNLMWGPAIKGIYKGFNNKGVQSVYGQVLRLRWRAGR